MASAPASAAETAGAVRSERRRRRSIVATFLMLLLLVSKSAAGILTIPLCLKYLGEEQTGLWLLMLTLWNFTFLGEMGIGQIAMNAAGRAYARLEFEDVSRVLTTSTLCSAVVSVALTIAAAGFVWLVPVERWVLSSSAKSAQDFKEYLNIIIFLGFLRLPAGAIAGVVSGLRDQHWRAALETIQVGLNTGLIVVVLMLGGGVRQLLWAVAFCSIVCSYGLLWVAERRHRFLTMRSEFLSVSMAKDFLRQMPAYLPLPVCLVLQRTAPILLVSHYVSLTYVPRIYLLVMAFRVLLVLMFDCLSKAVQPYIIMFEATGEHERTRFYWTLMTHVAGGTAAIVLSVTAFLYNPMASVLVGSTVTVSTPVVSTFAFLCLLEVILTPGVNFSLALGHFRSMSGIWILNGILSIGFGVLGARQPWVDPLLGIGLGYLSAHLVCYVPLQSGLFARILGASSLAYAGATVGRTMAASIPGLLLAVMTFYGGIVKWNSPAGGLYLGATVALWVGACWLVLLTSGERRWLSAQTRDLSLAIRAVLA